jgi:phosphatidylserine/phosphatidylglycerophosphate/cardiolipin synthase-like enzyme
VRIYARDHGPDLRSGLLGLLLAALDAEPSDVWLVSPWLREISLPISREGHFASVFGSHRDEIRLTDILLRIAHRHAVHVIAKPPHELVPLETLQRIVELLDDRDALARDDEARDYEAVERASTALSDEIAALGRDLTRHAETVAMLSHMWDAGIDVRVLDHLHAKLLWTPAGAILGSANFTHGGFARNEELMVEVSVAAQLAELRAAAEGFGQRSSAIASYSLTRWLERLGIGGTAFRALRERFASEFALEDPVLLLETLAIYARD